MNGLLSEFHRRLYILLNPAPRNPYFQSSQSSFISSHNLISKYSFSQSSPPTKTNMSSTNVPPSEPHLLLVSICGRREFRSRFRSLLAELASRIRVQRLNDLIHLHFQLTNEPRPAVVLLVDEALALDRNIDHLSALDSYVSQGGRCILACHFGNRVTTPDALSMFTRLGLYWMVHGMMTRQLTMNWNGPACRLPPTIPHSLTMSGQSIDGVALADAWYLFQEQSGTIDGSYAVETMVATARVGHGRIGFVGGVNDDSDTIAIIVRMCRESL